MYRSNVPPPAAAASTQPSKKRKGDVDSAAGNLNLAGGGNPAAVPATEKEAKPKLEVVLEEV